MLPTASQGGQHGSRLRAARTRSAVTERDAGQLRSAHGEGDGGEHVEVSGSTALLSEKGRSLEERHAGSPAAAAARPHPCARPERHAGSWALRSARSVAARGPRPGESEGGCGFSREMIRPCDVCLRSRGNEAAPVLGITNPPQTRTFQYSPRHGTYRRRPICMALGTDHQSCLQPAAPWAEGTRIAAHL